jgi:hypothetical protein
MRKIGLLLAACAVLGFQSAPAFAADSAERKDKFASVHSIGYMAPNAVLVFRDAPRTAYFVQPGQVINGFKVITVNDAAVIAEYEGQPFSVETTARTFPVSETALESYLAHLMYKIDKQHPGVTETTTVTIGANQGPVNDTSAVSYFVRSMPFGKLPAGVDSITFQASYGFDKPSTARMLQLQFSQPQF